jgi:sigma-B regulation protein RsbU (phosphoserine phosphatase)
VQTMPARSRVSAQLAFPLAHQHTPFAIDVAAYSKPARTFTGDFYLTHRTHDRLWFTLGDVSGKGAHAAVVMAMIQEELEHRIAACASTQCSPAATMQRLHEFLRGILPSNRFATVTIGTLRDDGLLTIVNAGHCPPLIAAASRVEEIHSTGPVAGLLPSSRWTSVTRQLTPGDAVLLFSDGLLEAASVSGEELGSHRIRHAFARASSDESDASAIVSQMLAAARTHTSTYDDDLTLLAIRYESCSRR